MALFLCPLRHARLYGGRVGQPSGWPGFLFDRFANPARPPPYLRNARGGSFSTGDEVEHGK
jgi:hypothetical protein